MNIIFHKTSTNISLLLPKNLKKLCLIHQRVIGSQIIWITFLCPTHSTFHLWAQNKLRILLHLYRTKFQIFIRTLRRLLNQSSLFHLLYFRIILIKRLHLGCFLWKILTNSTLENAYTADQLYNLTVEYRCPRLNVTFVLYK